MADRIRFHLDENVNSAVAAALRRVGADVSTTASAGLIGRSDLEQLAFVQGEGRVLVTHDDDFLTIASARDDHPGIAFGWLMNPVKDLGDPVRQGCEKKSP
jgi:predicted nuclease of predicted toxin-antitoxin system